MAAGVTRPVLLDNTVLTNLALVGRPELVTSLWPLRACTTPAVWKEYYKAVTYGLLPGGTWSRLTRATLTGQ